MNQVWAAVYPGLQISPPQKSHRKHAEYLNELTAEKSGLRVLAGPAEATAIGNLAAQMIAAGVFADYREARTCILQSCEVKCYSHTSIA